MSIQYESDKNLSRLTRSNKHVGCEKWQEKSLNWIHNHKKNDFLTEIQLKKRKIIFGLDSKRLNNFLSGFLNAKQLVWILKYRNVSLNSNTRKNCQFGF